MAGKIVRKSASKKKSLAKKPKITKKKVAPKVVPEIEVLPEEEEVEETVEEEIVAEEESGPESATPVEEKPKRAPRKKHTMETYLAKFDTLIEYVDTEITKRSKPVSDGGRGGKDVRFLKTVRKNLRELKNQAPKVIATKRGVSRDGNKVSGFVLPCKITVQLADFMGISHGSTPSRREITNAVCAYIRLKPDETREHMLKWEYLNKGRKRNLQNKERKMTINPDSVLVQLLDYESYCDDVKNGLISINKTNKKTNKKEKTVQTDNTLFYYVLQRLLRPHILETLSIVKSPEIKSAQ